MDLNYKNGCVQLYTVCVKEVNDVHYARYLSYYLHYTVKNRNFFGKKNFPFFPRITQIFLIFPIFSQISTKNVCPHTVKFFPTHWENFIPKRDYFSHSRKIQTKLRYFFPKFSHNFPDFLRINFPALSTDSEIFSQTGNFYPKFPKTNPFGK